MLVSRIYTRTKFIPEIENAKSVESCTQHSRLDSSIFDIENEIEVRDRNVNQIISLWEDALVDFQGDSKGGIDEERDEDSMEFKDLLKITNGRF